MTAADPHLIVRAAALYLAVTATAAAWLWRRPSPRQVAGSILATLWNLPALLAVHLAAARSGWWTFDAEGGLLLGMPVDLLLAWACLWGAVPAIAFPSAPLAVVLLVSLAADVALMPAAAPVVRLGPAWLAGEALALVAVLLPAQLLARWTARDTTLAGRAVLQALAFAGLAGFVVPAAIVENTGGAWRSPVDRPLWQIALIVQILAVPAIAGLTALQEFVARGGGTPVPFDPPKHLVTTGIYAYVRNPMQISGVLLLALAGAVLEHRWIAAAGVMAHLYSLGLAGWDEGDDMRRRFGDDWDTYRHRVRSWIPRWRPWIADSRSSRLYVDAGCDMCREVGGWFARRGARGLDVLPARSHPRGGLTRITYEPHEGRPASGVEALARALEHVHLGWAFAGFALRLPGVLQLVQLIVDASGGEPRVQGTGATWVAPELNCGVQAVVSGDSACSPRTGGAIRFGCPWTPPSSRFTAPP